MKVKAVADDRGWSVLLTVCFLFNDHLNVQGFVRGF